MIKASPVPPFVAHYRFHVQGRLGTVDLDLQATLSAPWTILFGPSGSGKSTALKALAGLVPRLQTTFDRHSNSTGPWQPLGSLAPQHRDLAYAPQHASLLPHLTVEGNLRFPESLRRVHPADSLVPEICDLLQLGPLLPKRPVHLSGGEQQRVSLGRALAVPGARLLLLDEPFAGLDRTRRDKLLPSLQTYLHARALPVLSVTHDPDEALLLAAEVMRIHEGKVLRQGPAATVLAEEMARLHTLLASNLIPR